MSTETAVEEESRYDIASGVLDKIFGPSWRDKQRNTGFKAVDEPCHVSDLHATILHLMGLDHTRLSFLHQGLNQRLTGVLDRRVIAQVLA